MKIRCPGCHIGLEIDRSVVGDKTQCPKCGTVLDLTAFVRAAKNREITQGHSNIKETGKPGTSSKKWMAFAVGALGIVLVVLGLTLYLRPGDNVNNTPPLMEEELAESEPPSEEGVDSAPSDLPPSDTEAPIPILKVASKSKEAPIKKATVKSNKKSIYTRKKGIKPRQAYFWEIPARSSVISVNGQRIQLNLKTPDEAPKQIRIYLPPGTHLVSAGKKSEWLHIKDDFFKNYLIHYKGISSSNKPRQKAAFQEQVRFLSQYGDHHSDSLAQHHLGNYYFLRGLRSNQNRTAFFEAAKFKYFQAVKNDPGLATTHLNLAHLFLEEEKKEWAKREIIIADIFNIENVFGIDSEVQRLKSKLGITRSHFDLKITWEAYTPPHPSEPIDIRFIHYHETVLRYISRHSEKAKVWSNLGLYFAKQTGKHRWAEKYYRKAFRTLKTETDPVLREKTFKVILKNLSLLATRNELPEKEEFELIYNQYKQGQPN